MMSRRIQISPMYFILTCFILLFSTHASSQVVPKPQKAWFSLGYNNTGYWICAVSALSGNVRTKHYKFSFGTGPKYDGWGNTLSFKKYLSKEINIVNPFIEIGTNYIFRKHFVVALNPPHNLYSDGHFFTQYAGAGLEIQLFKHYSAFGSMGISNIYQLTKGDLHNGRVSHYPSFVFSFGADYTFSKWIPAKMRLEADSIAISHAQLLDVWCNAGLDMSYGYDFIQIGAQYRLMKRFSAGLDVTLNYSFKRGFSLLPFSGLRASTRYFPFITRRFAFYVYGGTGYAGLIVPYGFDTRRVGFIDLGVGENFRFYPMPDLFIEAGFGGDFFVCPNNRGFTFARQYFSMGMGINVGKRKNSLQ